MILLALEISKKETRFPKIEVTFWMQFLYV